MSKHIDLVMDLNFGSTGKGLLIGWLASRGMYDTIMNANGPNSGHTYIDAEGRKFVHTQLPNGIVGDHVKRVMIGPGSILNLDKLLEEIIACEDIILSKGIKIFIHPHAAVVFPHHVADEQETMTGIGSTKKGVGAAMIHKIMRPTSGNEQNIVASCLSHPICAHPNVYLVNSPIQWLQIYGEANLILIEGAQGFGLSIHHGFYPYVTSRDVTPMQILADCGVPFGDAREVSVWGTCRTYPIRVANRFDADGKQVGWSGPHYADQEETSFESIGQPIELTTVTKLPRRIFTYSKSQMDFARGMCSPHVIFLNFVNYLKTYEQFKEIYEHLTADGTEVVCGIGPTVLDVIGGLPRDPELAWERLLEEIGQ